MTELPIHEVYAIRYATQPERPEGATFLGGDPSKMIRGLDFFTYVIKGPNGIFVVDTGFNADLSGDGGRNFLEEPSEIINKFGIDPKTVNKVLLTVYRICRYCHYTGSDFIFNEGLYFKVKVTQFR